MSLLLLILITVEVLPDKPCNRIQIGDQLYDREVIWSHRGKPYNLNVHKSTNTLFFSYTLLESFDTDFQLGSLNIETREFHAIAGIRGGCAVAIDNFYDVIFFGGIDGIYTYNVQTNLADFYKEENKNIWSLFFGKNLFYISYPEQRLYLEVDGKFAIVREFETFEIDHFYITSNDDIFFANKSGIFRFNMKLNKVELINELIVVRQMIEDGDGNFYICTNIGIFVNSLDEFDLKKVLDMKNLFGLAFDRDNNFIISDNDTIIKLLPSKSRDCQTTEPSPFW